MCLNPITLKNPNFKAKHFPLFADNISSKIQVPCGTCKECVALRQCYMVQRVQMLSKDYHIFMLTLTYNREHLPEVEVNGYRHSFVDFTHWQKMIKRMRKYNVLGFPFKYLVISEYGGRFHRPHIHALIFIKKEYIKRPFEWAASHFFDFYNYWAINVGSRTRPVFELLSTWKKSADGRRTYDFHWVNPYLIVNGKPVSENSVAFYVTKYVMKFDKWLDKKRKALKLSLSSEDYNYYWALFRPHCHFSHDFFPPKIITKYNLYEVSERYKPFLKIMKDTILLAPFHKNYVFCYLGKSYPLAPYLREYLKPLPLIGDWILGHFYMRRGEPLTDCPFASDPVEISDLEREGLVDVYCHYEVFAKEFNATYSEMIEVLCKAKENWTGCLGYIESRSDSEVESARRDAHRFYSRYSPLSDDYSESSLPANVEFEVDEVEYEKHEYLLRHQRHDPYEFCHFTHQLSLFEDEF